MNNRSKMTVSQGYQGMRWYKCDLHLHTPEDARHWRNPQGGLDRMETAKAVLDIMEGSEETCQRRKEKCHF